MKSSDGLVWKINYSDWLMNMLSSFIRYIGLPLVCTQLILNFELAPTVSTDTVMAVFAIYFILRMIRVLFNPPKYALEKSLKRSHKFD